MRAPPEAEISRWGDWSVERKKRAGEVADKDSTALTERIRHFNKCRTWAVTFVPTLRCSCVDLSHLLHGCQPARTDAIAPKCNIASPINKRWTKFMVGSPKPSEHRDYEHKRSNMTPNEKLRLRNVVWLHEVHAPQRHASPLHHAEHKRRFLFYKGHSGTAFTLLYIISTC